MACDISTFAILVLISASQPFILLLTWTLDVVLLSFQKDFLRSSKNAFIMQLKSTFLEFLDV